LNPFFDAMRDCALPAMFDVGGEVVIHHAPGGEAGGDSLTALFEELDTPENEQHDRRDGLKRIRTAKLTLPSTVAVTLGKVPSCFAVRDELWTARAIAAGPNVISVRLEREENATQSRATARSYQ
jgi:hypothetical protein